MTDKIISKSFGLIVDINNVVPSKKALSIARKTRLDPRFIELVLRNSDEILAVVPIKRIIEKKYADLYSLTIEKEALGKLLEEYPVFFITTREGSLWSDAGIDSSNLPPYKYSIPIKDHDEIAKYLRNKIRTLTDKDIAVVICDTEVFLTGSLEFARGSYGIDPIDRCFGCKDLYGKPKYGGVDIVVHELCSASALLFKQTIEGIPIVIIRGLKYKKCECGMKESVPKVKLEKIIKETIKETFRIFRFKILLKILEVIF